MALNLVQQFFFKLFAYIMLAIYAITPPVAPSTDDVIKPAKTDAQLVFATVADPQVSNYMFDRYRAFQASCEDIKNAERLDAIVGIGDIAENGLAEEYNLAYASLSGMNARYIMATGNHDIRLRLYQQSTSRIYQFTDALNGEGSSMAESVYEEGKLAYSEYVNGYKFIVMGSDRTEFEEAYISPEQLEWLDNELATEKGKPVFVVLHQPLKLTHNLPTTWGNGTNKEAGSVGAQSDDIKAILAKHAKDSTVVLITGHLHAGFSQYSFQEIEGFYSLNVPALSIENKDGEEGGNGSGLTYIVEVYKNEILFRARNCRTGEWLTKWDAKIAL